MFPNYGYQHLMEDIPPILHHPSVFDEPIGDLFFLSFKRKMSCKVYVVLKFPSIGHSLCIPDPR
jgi:hypothetical protein